MHIQCIFKRIKLCIDRCDDKIYLRIYEKNHIVLSKATFNLYVQMETVNVICKEEIEEFKKECEKYYNDYTLSAYSIKMNSSKCFLDTQKQVYTFDLDFERYYSDNLDQGLHDHLNNCLLQINNEIGKVNECRFKYFFFQISMCKKTIMDIFEIYLNDDLCPLGLLLIDSTSIKKSDQMLIS